jgi:hypothetical protein
MKKIILTTIISLTALYSYSQNWDDYKLWSKYPGYVLTN